jgi:hypothetical protein
MLTQARAGPMNLLVALPTAAVVFANGVLISDHSAPASMSGLLDTTVEVNLV